MRTIWFLPLLSLLLTLGLIIVLTGQHQEMERLRVRNEEIIKFTNAKYIELQKEEDFKEGLQRLLVKGETTMKGQKVDLDGITEELKNKEKEAETCQEQLKLTKDQMAEKEEANKQTAVTLNVESEFWKLTIIQLKANLTSPSPICDYVKENTDLKLCPNKLPKEDKTKRNGTAASNLKPK